MNKAQLEGYISIGKYGGPRVTDTGKECTKFQIASGKGEKRQYFDCTVWHDEHGTQLGVVDGKYCHVEATPRAWRKDGKGGVDFTVLSIWHAPEREHSEGAVQAEMFADDLPF